MKTNRDENYGKLGRIRALKHVILVKTAPTAIYSSTTSYLTQTELQTSIKTRMRLSKDMHESPCLDALTARLLVLDHFTRLVPEDLDDNNYERGDGRIRTSIVVTYELFLTFEKTRR
jgi:hypothetical protein